jgi:hypothetical protein
VVGTKLGTVCCCDPGPGPKLGFSRDSRRIFGHGQLRSSNRWESNRSSTCRAISRSTNGSGEPVPFCSSAAEAGLSQAKLRAMSAVIRSDQFRKIGSVLIARHGRLAYEDYVDGDPNTLRDTRSATKSITDVLVGIAIQGGKLSGVDAKVTGLSCFARSIRRRCRQSRDGLEANGCGWFIDGDLCGWRATNSMMFFCRNEVFASCWSVGRPEMWRGTAKTRIPAAPVTCERICGSM